MTDTEILNQIQAVLMEPVDGGATFLSGLWTRDEILANMNERQNRFLKLTQGWLGIANLPITADQPMSVIGVNQFNLPQDWLTTAAVTWFGDDGTIRPLERSDSFELDLGLTTWQTTTGTPRFYLDEDSPLLTITVAPAADAEGHYELIYVPQGSDLTGADEPFAMTNEYAQQVGKYGTLADIFGKDGRGQNPSKAAYCEQRFQLAVMAAGIVLRGWT